MKELIKLYKEKRYLINSPDNIEVDSHNVVRKIKKGRTLLLCDCENGTKFCKEPTICRHKEFFILLPLLRKLNEKIDDLEIYYRGAVELNKQIKPEHILEELESLRRLE